ncbi:MAG: tetratricopeptide repeat protein [Planctomycetota bacterium]|nr:MAG: tetratricopeptide repeat protein [Planctomycetota bacterium]REK22325.1 MAG: tetratricopeptide repeat protein [Planctomycetota bacterium]REK41048.1 MAG: tetratricopeptide repeat protein [Planctomycetota bacterium]
MASPAPLEAERRPLGWWHAAGLLGICLLAFLVYANSLHVPFHFDDQQSILDNRYVHIDAWDWQQLRDVLTIGRIDGGHARPLAYLSFAVNYYFAERSESTSRPHPFGFHVVNVAIHAICGMLVYLLTLITVRLWGRQRGDVPAAEFSYYLMALFAGCLFVAHPIQTQAVTYIVQRMTSMATMFYLGSLLYYVVGRLCERSALRWICWVAAVVCAVAALATKQIAVTLPVVIFLYEWFFFRDLDFRWLRRALLRYIVPVAVLLTIVALLYTGGDPLARVRRGYEKRNFTMAQRLYTQPRVVMFYLSLVAYPEPSRLSLLHYPAYSDSLLDPPTSLLSLIVLVGFLLLAIVLARQQRIVAFGILWFFLNLVLESSFIALEMVYEHRLYLPLFGVVLALAYLLFALVPTRWQAWAVVAATLMVAYCANGTVQRNNGWHDPLRFWKDQVERTEKLSPRAREDNRVTIARTYNNYFLMLTRASTKDGRPETQAETEARQAEARRALEQALEFDPEYAVSHYNLAVIYEGEGELSQAIAEYGRAVEFEPNYASAYYRRGRIHQRLGQHDKAIEDFTLALECPGEFPQAHYYRAKAYVVREEFELAVEDFTALINLEEVPADVYRERAHCYRLLGETAKADADAATARRLQASGQGRVPQHEE